MTPSSGSRRHSQKREREVASFLSPEFTSDTISENDCDQWNHLDCHFQGEKWHGSKPNSLNSSVLLGMRVNQWQQRKSYFDR